THPDRRVLLKDVFQSPNSAEPRQEMGGSNGPLAKIASSRADRPAPLPRARGPSVSIAHSRCLESASAACLTTSFKAATSFKPSASDALKPQLASLGRIPFSGSDASTATSDSPLESVATSPFNSFAGDMLEPALASLGRSFFSGSD